MNPLLIVAAFVAGTFNAIEAGTNSALRKGLGGPMWSVAAIALITLVGATLSAVATGERFPTMAQAAGVPWWGWLGGVLGLGFVMAMVLTAETLGAALFIGLTVTASTAGSVLLDHFGWIGFEQHSAGPGRLIGCLFMIVGVSLIARF